MSKKLGGPRGKIRQITLAASLSAVYFVLRSVPTFSMIGISGQFTAGDFVLTSIALIGGLWSGTISVLIGTFLAYAVRPPIFYGLDFLPAVANVSICALLLSGRCKLARGSYVFILVVFLASPYSLLYGYDHIPYVWLHLIALVVLLSPAASKIPSWIKEHNYRMPLAIAILAFVGTMAQHLTGGLLFEMVAGYAAGIAASKFVDVWRIIFLLYPEERIVVTVASTILAIAIFRSSTRWPHQT